jgi:hypothetical protein
MSFYCFFLVVVFVKYFAHRACVYLMGLLPKAKGSIPWCWNISSRFGIIVFLMGFQRKECVSANYSLVQIRHSDVLWKNLHYGSRATIMLCYFYFLYLKTCQQTSLFSYGRPQIWWCSLIVVTIIISLLIMHMNRLEIRYSVYSYPYDFLIQIQIWIIDQFGLPPFCL